jgi:nucleoporin NUP42
MTKDVTPGVDKPLWPLSSYGPAKFEPVLIANLDESPDELRVRAVMASKAGSINDYVRLSYLPVIRLIHL